MKTYFISGIAADGRLFRHIRLPAGFDAVYLKWNKPRPDESLENYADRLAEKINTDEPFVLIGTPLGGIITMNTSNIRRLYCRKITEVSLLCSLLQLFYFIYPFHQ